MRAPEHGPSSGLSSRCNFVVVVELNSLSLDANELKDRFEDRFEFFLSKTKSFQGRRF